MPPASWWFLPAGTILLRDAPSHMSIPRDYWTRDTEPVLKHAPEVISYRLWASLSPIHSKTLPGGSTADSPHPHFHFHVLSSSVPSRHPPVDLPVISALNRSYNNVQQRTKEILEWFSCLHIVPNRKGECPILTMRCTVQRKKETTEQRREDNSFSFPKDV